MGTVPVLVDRAARKFIANIHDRPFGEIDHHYLPVTLCDYPSPQENR